MSFDLFSELDRLSRADRQAPMPFRGRFIARRQDDGTVLLVGVCDGIDGATEDDALVALSGEIEVKAMWTGAVQAEGGNMLEMARNGGLRPDRWRKRAV